MSGKTSKQQRRKFDQQARRMIRGFIADMKGRPFFERLRAAWAILKG